MIAAARKSKQHNWIWMVVACLGVLVGYGSTGVAQSATVAPDQIHVGDRLYITIEGPLTLNDTLVVREGPKVQIPNMADISVAGVRRVDAQKYLAQEIGKYVKNAVVKVVPLVRIGVFGEVGRPGFYSVPSDALLSDVVMRAGGPTGSADLGKTVIKRAGKQVVDKQGARAGLDQGKTLDQLAVAPGDEIEIGRQKQFGIQNVLQVSSLLLGIIGLVYTLHHR